MKQRGYFATLDLLRGVAAIVVVIYHERLGFGMMTAISAANIGSHGYLAVDFFFQLSGFIIAASYDARLKQGMSTLEFVRIRMVRLYPLIFLSLLLGLFAYTLHSSFQIADPVLYFFKGLFFIPAYSAGHNVFPLNFPLWSILFELFVNILLAAYFAFLTNRRILMVIAVSAAVTIGLAICKNSIDFGAGYPGLPGGAPRTAMSFFGGVMMFRLLERLPKLRIGSLAAAVILSVILLAPVPRFLSWPYDTVAVLILFPALIILSANLSYGTWVEKGFGAVSYPIYVVHAPTILLCVITGRYLGLDPASTSFGIITIFAVVVLAVIALKVWDEPVRRWFRRPLSLRLPERRA